MLFRVTIRVFSKAQYKKLNSHMTCLLWLKSQNVFPAFPVLYFSMQRRENFSFFVYEKANNSCGDWDLMQKIALSKAHIVLRNFGKKMKDT